MGDEAACLVVARFIKPHGMKGEAQVYPMTDEPEAVFVPGRRLWPVTEAGEIVGDPVTVSRGRPYQRRWLLTLKEAASREDLEAWPQQYLGAMADELRPPGDGELYVHEVPGMAVVEGDRTIGVARELVGHPGHQYLVVDRDGRDVLIPFREPIVGRIDRVGRRLVVELPEGLLEL